MWIFKKRVPAFQYLGGHKDAVRIADWVNSDHNSYASWYPADKHLRSNLTLWVQTSKGLEEVKPGYWVYFENNKFEVSPNFRFKFKAIKE